MLHSVLKSLLSTLRITVTAARWLFVIFTLVLMFTGKLYWESANLNHAFSWHDLIHIIMISVLMLLFGWSGFSSHGRKLLEGTQYQIETSNLARALKVLFASGAMAFGVLIIFVMLVLIIKGPELITVQSFSWGFYLLTAICFPFVYKWLK